MYTTDGFATEAKLLRKDTHGCRWARSSALITTGDEDLNKNRILCIASGKYSAYRRYQRLLISDNYFKSEEDEEEPSLADGRTVQGISNMATVKKYLLVASRSEGTDEMALYVTDDVKTWHRAEFPHDHKLEEDAYTVLESTNYSIQVDVLTTP